MARMSRLMLAALALFLVGSIAGAAVKTGITASQPTLQKKIDDSRLIPEATMPMVPYVQTDGAKVWYLQEGFEVSWLPAGWDSTRLGGTTAFLSRVTAGTYPTCTPHGGTNMVKFNSFSAGSGNRIRLATPPVKISSLNDSLTFWMTRDPGYTTNNDRIVIEIMTNSGGVWGAWTAIDSISRYQASFAWVYQARALGAYLGDSVRIGLTGHSQYGNSMYLDDVAIGSAFTPASHDMSVLSIDVPATAIVQPGAVLNTALTIKNLGTSPESDFDIVYTINDSTGAQVYGTTFPFSTPDTLLPDSTHQQGFSTFTPDSFMRYEVIAWTTLAGDGHPENDTLRFDFRTYDRNVGATAIAAPGANCLPSATVAPSATYHNFATQAATFDAYFQIDFGGGPVYLENVTIAGLAPGADTTITFPDWTAPHDVGAHQVYAYTYQDLDLNPANDTAQQTTMVAFMGWTPLAPTAAVPVQWPGTCTDGSKLYVVGGLSAAGVMLNNVQVYDTATGWSQLTTLPVPLFSTSCAVIGQNLYVIGGIDTLFTAYGNNQIYDITGGTWSTGTASPETRGGCGGGVVDGKMYFVGGAINPGAAWPTDCPTFEYNPAADTGAGTPWAAKTACPRGAGGLLLGASFYGAPGLDMVYAGGDYRGTTSSLNTYYSYDPAGDSWTTIAAPPADVGGMAPGLAWSNDHAYLFGGNPAGSWTAPYSAKTYTYDPLTDAWTDASINLSSAYEGMAFGIIDNKLYSFGGTIGTNAINPPPFEYTYTLEYTGISGTPVAVTAPGTFTLYGNYPNPFRRSTTIRYQLAKAGRVSLAVYSITGQLVKTLVSESRPAGYQTVTWNGQDNSGRAVSSGIYFYRLNAGGNNATGKLVFVR